MSSTNRSERRPSLAERRPSVLYIPPVIPQLVGLEKPQEHMLKMDHCDVLIIGTGLVESMLAAALAWQGVEILHIDRNNYYGDLCSTMTIDQLKQWCNEVNEGKVQDFQNAQLYIPGGKAAQEYKSKDYGIDLLPKIMFAKSDLLMLLIRSRVYKYLEFQSLSNFHVFENDDFSKKISNTSKEDIFTDQSLSLVTKRSLMKFLKFCLQDNSDPLKHQILADNVNVPIAEFLSKKFNLNTPQINELVYSIGLCSNENTLTPVALSRIKRFLTSFDVYGKFPVMVLKYGGPGELSQGFCRSAAVAGTTYKLNTSLLDYDPVLNVAKFNDGTQVKVNEKIVISPTQMPDFLQHSYKELTENKESYIVLRLITIVKNDCKEWISEHESSAVVVFPPHTLPSDNEQAVQFIIQNENSGVCPEGQSVWFAHTVEQNMRKARDDLESALDKMEKAILRESSSDLEKVLEEKDFVINPQGTPILVNSFKLGESLQSFVPKERLEFVCKLGYVQRTFIKSDLSNVLSPSKDNNISCDKLKDAENIVFSNMPSSEISYDGIISECKLLYSRITGSDDDFFDVDFEDDDDEYNNSEVPDEVTKIKTGASSTTHPESINRDENAIESDEDLHQPFAADEMDL